jgi:hypothetical protein
VYRELAADRFLYEAGRGEPKMNLRVNPGRYSSDDDRESGLPQRGAAKRDQR